MRSAFRAKALFLATAAAASLTMIAAAKCPPVCVSGTLFQGISAGLSTTCIHDATGKAICYGTSVGNGLGTTSAHADGYVPNAPMPASTAHGLGPILDVATAQNSEASCAIRNDGSVVCWGWQSGASSTALPKTVVNVAGLSGAKEISVGGFRACALLTDKTVTCWNMNPQTGTIDAPQPVAGLSSISHIAIGETHACALRTDATVWCWGKNEYGQLGLGSADAVVHTTPTAVPNLNASVIAVGWKHTCAVQTDHDVSCWGWNSQGEIGLPAQNIPQSFPVPRRVVGSSTATHVSAGNEFTCAVLADGSVKCWGDNSKGQLGVGAAPKTSGQPLTVPGLSNMVLVSAGNTHACASGKGLAIKCWGQNESGQLANGSTNPSLTPTPP